VPTKEDETVGADRAINSDPEVDLRHALERNDKRFLAMEVGALFVPGMEAAPELVNRYGIKCIVGVGDDSSSEPLNKSAEYAQIYNMLLYRHLWRSGEVQWRDFAIGYAGKLDIKLPKNVTRP